MIQTLARRRGTDQAPCSYSPLKRQDQSALLAWPLTEGRREERVENTHTVLGELEGSDDESLEGPGHRAHTQSTETPVTAQHLPFQVGHRDRSRKATCPRSYG